MRYLCIVCGLIMLVGCVFFAGRVYAQWEGIDTYMEGQGWPKVPVDNRTPVSGWSRGAIDYINEEGYNPGFIEKEPSEPSVSGWSRGAIDYINEEGYNPGFIERDSSH